MSREEILTFGDAGERREEERELVYSERSIRSSRVLIPPHGQGFGAASATLRSALRRKRARIFHPSSPALQPLVTEKAPVRAGGWIARLRHSPRAFWIDRRNDDVTEVAGITVYFEGWNDGLSELYSSERITSEIFISIEENSIRA